MLNREAPAPFVIVGDTPGGELAIPVSSARAAAQAARHLTQYCPHTRATWQVNSHAGPGPVVVFGCARPRTDEHLPDQDTHAFLLVRHLWPAALTDARTQSWRSAGYGDRRGAYFRWQSAGSVFDRR